MILENLTRYRTADLEAVILGALAEAGITAHGRDRVIVSYGSYSGFAYLGKITRWRGHPRMRIRIPRPTSERQLDVARFVWLVRHEVGHWRGLEHSQMAPSLLYWHRCENRRRVGPVGSELPMPEWAQGMVVVVLDEPEAVTSAPPRPDPNIAREKKRDHALTMLARAERRAKLAATIVKRWKRRAGAAERALQAAKRPTR